MAALSTAIQNVLREELESGIRDTLGMLDVVYQKTILTSQRVERNRQGRGYKVIKTYGVGLSGGAKFESPDTESTITGPENFNVFGAPSTYPGIDEVTAPTQFQANVSLIQHRGNFFLPIEYMRFDDYNASIGSLVAQLTQGVSKKIAQQEASAFYTDATYKALGDVGDSSVTMTNVSGNTSAMTINLAGTSASGRVHRFMQGMLIDLYKSDGTVKRNADFMLGIDDVDALNNIITVVRLDGGEFQAATSLNGGITYGGSGGDNDIIVLKDSLSHSLVNMNSWIVNSGTLFGVDLAKHSCWKSYIPSAESAPLTENLLNKRYYKVTESYPDLWLETAITTNGILLGFIDNLDTGAAGSGSAQYGRFRFDRNGETLKPRAGFSGFEYSFNGRPVTIHTSTYLDEGYWYGLSLRDGNLKRYVPPPLPGARKDSKIGHELEFIAPIGGSDSIFAHATVAGRLTDFVQAPFKRQFQIMPEDPRSMKLSGITPISL